MSSGIKALPGESSFQVKADADAVVVNDQGEVIEPAAVLQSGAGLPEGDSLSAELVSVPEFHPEHHRTYWPLKRIYDADPALGLALSDLDDNLRVEFEGEADREQGYLEDVELNAASTPEQKAALRRFQKLIEFSKNDPAFDPRRIDQLLERHPELAEALATLDRPGSIRLGYADSYKVSRLSPELQARYKKVDATLRSEDQTDAWKRVDQQVGRNMLPTLAGLGTLGGMAGLGLPVLGAVAMGWIALPIAAMASAMWIGMDHAFRGSGGREAELRKNYGRLYRFLGRPLRAFRTRRTRQLVTRNAAAIVANEPDHALKAIKALKAANPKPVPTKHRNPTTIYDLGPG